MRDCEHCIHSKTVYAEHIHAYVKSCEAWDCEFERKNDEDISDNACHENRAEQGRKEG